MKVAHYIGRHRHDNLRTRAGWACVRAVQRGRYRRVTHCEAILDEHPDGSVTIASSSLRDGGVRAKRVMLSPGAWLIADVPAWDVQKARAFAAATDGRGYDLRGALATVLPFRQDPKRYFCTEWVAAPYLHSPHTFGPAQLCAITMSPGIGRDVTAEFFGVRS